MADNSILDKALGLFSSVQDARKEGRNDLMRTILPEVLQPEELKQAAAPMKEEASKTLHAPKYDRRMKFNTALERSGHKATSEEPVQAKEDPAWLKEAAAQILEDEEPSYGRRNALSIGTFMGTAGLGMGAMYPMDKTLRGRLLSPLILGSLGGGLGAFAGSMVKNSPIKNSYNNNEFTPTRAAIMGIPAGLVSGGLLTSIERSKVIPELLQPALAGMGGGLTGILADRAYTKFQDKKASDPAFDFAGVTGREGVVTVEDELERTPPLPTEEPMEYDVANKPVMQKESAGSLPVNKEVFSVAEPTVSEKIMPIVGGVGMGVLPITRALFNPELKGLPSLGLAGLASAGLGLGTYGLLRYRQKKHREQAQSFVDNLNAIANSLKTAAYPEDETFTQRHPWVLPAGVGLLGAAAGAIPGGLLAGRQAVKSVTNRYNKRLADLGTEFSDATSIYGGAAAGKATSKAKLDELERAARDAEKAFAKATENKPDLGYHKALGHVGGGTLGGLTGGSLGVLGGLAANKPQPWEQ
jgi:hypothetical protein